jgi:hypothetical protein
MTTTDVREWLRAHPEVTGGEEVAPKGNIRKPWQAAYDAAHPADPVQSPTALDNGEADYDLGVTKADFIQAAEPPDDTGETPPRRRRTRAAQPAKTGRLGKLFDRKPKPGARKHPRIKLDNFAEGIWTDLAQVAPFPPLRTILSFQGAYAATVLDDVVAGTFLDPILQPAARAEGTLRAIDGLFGPPIFTALICMAHRVETNAAGEPLYDEAGWPVFDGRTQMMFAGLKYSILQMSRIADMQMEEIEQKAAEIDERNRKADALIAVMFAGWRKPPAGEAPPAGPPVQQQGNGRPPVVPGFVYPQPPQMDDTGADPGRT